MRIDTAPVHAPKITYDAHIHGEHEQQAEAAVVIENLQKCVVHLAGIPIKVY